MMPFISCTALLLAFINIFFFTPEEISQGLVQKIFYVHLSCAMMMYVGFLLSFIFSVFYLIEKRVRWDGLALVSSEVGFLFCTLVLSTGPIWARPIWGTWWTWEPRLTTTFILWLTYASYFVLRQNLNLPKQRATASAVISILAAINIPLIHFSVKIWRGIHPTVLNSKNGGLPLSMKKTLLLTVLSFLIWFVALFFQRWKLEKSKIVLSNIKNKE